MFQKNRVHAGKLHALTATVSTGVLAAALLAVPAMAQDKTAKAPDASQQDKVPVIIVTARFRAENIQKVPMSVTAFDQTEMRRRGMEDLNDIARFTAGFSFEDAEGGRANASIRGQSTLRVTAHEQTVSTFVDGIYMPLNYVVNLGAADWQRIEIVKGPQSARYGRNAFAGAINYVSQRPANQFAANGEMTIGNDDRFDISGAVSVPLVNDKIAFRGAYRHSYFDGSWRNIHPNAYAGFSPGTNGNVGGWKDQSYSGLLVVKPIDRVDLEFEYIHFDKNEEARAYQALNSGIGQGNCGALQLANDGTSLVPSLYCGEFGVQGDTVNEDPRGFGRQAHINIYRASAKIKMTDAFTLFYQYGRVAANSKAAASAEADPIHCGTILGTHNGFPDLCNWQGSPFGDLSYNQHELRLTYDNGGAIHGTLGGFYLHGLDHTYAVSINLPPLATTSIDIQSTSYGGFANFVFAGDAITTIDKSVFGELGFGFNKNRTRLTLEGRYSETEIRDVDIRHAPVQVGDSTFKFFTPRITLEHDLTPDNHLYISAARGAKAGGFNAKAVSDYLKVFNPAFNWTYEAGSKNTFANGTLTANLAIYYTSWTALQINTLDPKGTLFTGSLTANLGDARIYGFELEGAWRPTDSLSFDYAASYTNAEYKQGTVDALYTAGNPPNYPPPCDNVVCSTDGAIGGNMLERSPAWQLALGGQYQGQFTDHLGYYLRADVTYQSKAYVNSVNTAWVPPRTVVNTRIGFDYKKMFHMAFWVRNLFDSKYVADELSIIQPASVNILQLYYGERRTFGLTTSFDF